MFEGDDRLSITSREEKILTFWREKGIFKKSLFDGGEKGFFSFYDGPPFATGLPHYGHLLAGTIKDVIPRYKTMQGYRVPRRFGWDCHGLPVENEIEKAQGLSGAPAIEAFGIDKFNEECRNIVLRYTEQWKQTVERMGRWVDFDETYRTMDPPFMESVWWVFAQLYAKGLVYEGFKVMPFSAKLGTPISNFEANLNYKDVDDPALTVTFPLLSHPQTAFLAWTTTPWTLPSNLALAVGPEIDYIEIEMKEGQQRYILAASRLLAHFKEEGAYRVIRQMKGRDLEGIPYRPLFSYFTKGNHPAAFHVLVDDFVSTEEGTGVVHMAPAFGEVDFFACSKAGIEIVCPVDHNGKFSKEVPECEGLFVKDADREIIRILKKEGRVFHHGQIHHRYPFCWRSDTPLIYRAVRTWFIAVEKIKPSLLKNNAKIHFVPDHIKEGRFGKWLENARDWAVSRNRYWGTPIPIWRSDDGEIIVIDSVAELERRSGEKIVDLHRHFVDRITFMENGKVFKRIPEVFDCWFESGAMPYAQNHYPFENRESTLETFPADFIAEGLDQTRGWFYTLHVLGSALFDLPAFKHVIVNGIILAEDGNKMSKRLKNYPDPEKVIHLYGADAIRLFLLSSPAVVAEDLRFSEKGVEQVMRQVLIPFWNAYLFLATYARIYNWQPTKKGTLPAADMDRWVVSRLQKLVRDVTHAMESYELSQAMVPIVEFIDALTNWYIRRSRSRFWADEESVDRSEAFETLYQVLITLSQVCAPFIPFLSEEIYLRLRQKDQEESVHLCRFPEEKTHLSNKELEQEMGLTQLVVSCGHALRKECKMKVRQPLRCAHLIARDSALLSALKRQESLIGDELNVKALLFSQQEEGYVSLSCKPNFRILGKKVGNQMKEAQEKIETLSREEVERLSCGNPIEIVLAGSSVTLDPTDVTIRREVKEGLVARTEGGITIVLDVHLDSSLIEEGIARELINKINTMRKEAGFFVTDRIALFFNTTEKIKESFASHRDLIMHEVLATQVTFDGAEGGSEWDINGEKTSILILKQEVDSGS